ncbi:MAG: hypothetical protein GXP33_06965 [Spirochaetes bacterium]|nr:hypothetical protein [Spirochaetota bacterium]
MIIDWLFPAVVLSVIGLIARGLKKKESGFKKFDEKPENEAEYTNFKKSAPDNRKNIKEEYKTVSDSKIILVEEIVPEKAVPVNKYYSEPPELSGLKKIKKLKPLRQAVVWAELLGKPRSEKEKF